jgi:hypothetical protein
MANVDSAVSLDIDTDKELELGSQLKAFPDMREVSISGKFIDGRSSAVPAGHDALGRCNRRVQP